MSDLTRLLLDVLRARLLVNADALLTQPAPFPVVEIKTTFSPARDKQIIYDGGQGVGMFIQSIQCDANATLTINRLDGPSYNPRDEETYIGEPIRRLYVTHPNTVGIFHIRIFTNPIYSIMASPRTKISDVRIRDVNGGIANPATFESILDLIGRVNQLIKVYNPSNGSPAHGQVKLERTLATQFPNVSVPMGKVVIIHASPDNEYNVYIGGPSVNQLNGYILGPGEDTPPLYLQNLNHLYGRSDPNAPQNQTVCYIIEKPLDEVFW
ncbi:MAG: hypothetical protein QXI19_14985 [Candidatus Caldarchaeum sp.]